MSGAVQTQEESAEGKRKRLLAEKLNKKMAEESTGKLYDLWAGVYDHTFGALVHRRQTRAIQELRARPGERILDLGVGTGLSLVKYPAGTEVVGVDLSGGMLDKARDRLLECRREDRGSVTLAQADAMNTPFADGSFDHVMISHVISVVSDPNRLLREAKRLLKPGGRIVVLNHFQSASPALALAEGVLNPVFVKIGWRSDLTLEECVEGLGLRVMYHFKLSAVDFWQIVVLGDGQGASGERRQRASEEERE